MWTNPCNVFILFGAGEAFDLVDLDDVEPDTGGVSTTETSCGSSAAASDSSEFERCFGSKLTR